jgi:hypothetical protein
VIFVIVEYLIMEWTMPNESMQDVQEGAYPKTKKSVAGQFAAVKYKSETYCWTQKVIREDYRVDKYWVLLSVVKE